ncbi:hypothetical protein FB45DRAFT_843771 [Roridomyces roridus]|uniref:AB hydrolase-1 domain-containing protein n=1 Tax=Roridomyces roridus TaxID=1738132 RepID=A0AAD7B6N3_9AGAR|nr:hypothetical protein FB45DRAFT_843771 [Roridomyces roridus]
MIGQSVPEYLFIRATVVALRLVAPASFWYLLACAATQSFLVSPLIAAAASCEATFYVIFRLRLKRLNRTPPPVPPRLSRSQRRALIEKCSAEISFDYASGWFLPSGSQVKRENVREWILWAMFASTSEDASPEWDEEIDEYIAVLETNIGRQVDPGRVHGVQSLRLSFDPIHALHRPLIWYLIVAGVDTLTSIFLLSLGFKHYSPGARSFPPRPLLTLFSKPAANAYFPYWYRPPRSNTPFKTPILFLHGIGIGLHPYVPMLREIIRADPTQPLLLVEFLPVSMHMTAPMPPRRATLGAINAILEDLDIPKVVLAAHSYGTFLAAQILTPPPSCSTEPGPDPAQILNTKITSLVLIDPIPLLLHLPAVAYNFLYRPPGAGRANEWQLWYFASRDLDVARVLGRCFFWEEGCLWKEDLQRFCEGGRRKVAIVLGGRDQIVPSREVRDYLTAHEPGGWGPAGGGADRWMSPSPREGELEVLWFAELDHATVFEKRERRRVLMQTLERLTDGVEDQDAI